MLNSGTVYAANSGKAAFDSTLFGEVVMDVYSLSTVVLLTFNPVQDLHSQVVIEQRIPTVECKSALEKYRDSFTEGTWKMYICRYLEDS